MTLRTSLQNVLDGPVDSLSLLVVSDTHVGSELASKYASRTDVCLVTDRRRVAERPSENVETVVGDPTSPETLEATGDVTAAVVALRTDRQALLVTQLLRTNLNVESVVVLLNDPDRTDAIAETATAVVCRSTCLARALQQTVNSTLSISHSS